MQAPVVLSIQELASGQMQVLFSGTKIYEKWMHWHVLFDRRTPVLFFPLRLEHEKHFNVSVLKTPSVGQQQSFNLAFQTKDGRQAQALAEALTYPVPFVTLSAQGKQRLDELMNDLGSQQTQAKVVGLNVKVGLHWQTISPLLLVVLSPVPYLVLSGPHDWHLPALLMIELIGHLHAFQEEFHVKVGLQLQARRLAVAVPGLFSIPTQLSQTPPASY